MQAELCQLYLWSSAPGALHWGCCHQVACPEAEVAWCHDCFEFNPVFAETGGVGCQHGPARADTSSMPCNRETWGCLLFRCILMVNSPIFHLHLSRIDGKPVWETHTELVTVFFQATSVKQWIASRCYLSFRSYRILYPNWKKQKTTPKSWPRCAARFVTAFKNSSPTVRCSACSYFYY